MTIRYTILTALVASAALLGPAVTAQTAPAPATPPISVAVTPAISAKPALWKISDADTTIYLFGTIHLLPAGIDWYHGPVAKAFEGSQELVTELPEVGELQTVSTTLKLASLPEGQTLRSQFSADELGKYEGAMKTIGLPVGAFDRYKPWFAAVALATLPLQKAGYALDNGIDNQLAKRNKALGRPRIGLETLDFQLGIFNGFTPELQKTYLFSVIDALPTLTQEIDKMVASWTRGDIETLAAALNEETDDPAMMQALLTDRNRTWAGWIDNRLDQPGTVFIAVGAGHLGGKDSVQAFLAKDGIKSVRVQ